MKKFILSKETLPILIDFLTKGAYWYRYAVFFHGQRNVTPEQVVQTQREGVNGVKNSICHTLEGALLQVTDSGIRYCNENYKGYGYGDITIKMGTEIFITKETNDLFFWRKTTLIWKDEDYLRRLTFTFFDKSSVTLRNPTTGKQLRKRFPSSRNNEEDLRRIILK